MFAKKIIMPGNNFIRHNFPPHGRRGLMVKSENASNWSGQKNWREGMADNLSAFTIAFTLWMVRRLEVVKKADNFNLKSDFFLHYPLCRLFDSFAEPNSSTNCVPMAEKWLDFSASQQDSRLTLNDCIHRKPCGAVVNILVIIIRQKSSFLIHSNSPDGWLKTK